MYNALRIPTQDELLTQPNNHESFALAALRNVLLLKLTTAENNVSQIELPMQPNDYLAA